MRRTVRLLPLAALIIGVFSFALPGSVAAQSAPEGPPQLVVRGQGLVATRPDLAVVTLGASVRREGAGEAFNRSNELISQVYAALREQGIDTDRDVATRQFSLSPEYGRTPTDGPAPIVAWRAVNILSIKIRDFGKIGPVIDASAAILGNEAQISGINFTLENSEAAARQARDAAIADARERAQQIAQAAGVRLVRVLSINETSAPSAPVVRAAPTAAAAPALAATEVSAGELTVSVSVEIIYEIE